MSLFGRRGSRTASHPAYLFSPSIGGLLAFGAIFGGAYFLWPMLGFDSHPYVTGQVTSSTTVGYDSAATASLPTHLSVTRIRSVYDGDTFRIESSELVSDDDKGIPIRIRGVDAAEINGDCKREILLARASRQWLVERLNLASTISLTDVAYHEDAYDRAIADVLVDGKSLADQMIASGAAVSWRVGAKPIWCDRP